MSNVRASRSLSSPRLTSMAASCCWPPPSAAWGALAGLIYPLFVRRSAARCGYEDADDLDHLRTDPGFKLACGRLPAADTTCARAERWENAPSASGGAPTYAMAYWQLLQTAQGGSDDTVDVAHGLSSLLCSTRTTTSLLQRSMSMKCCSTSLPHWAERERTAERGDGVVRSQRGRSSACPEMPC